MRNTSLKPVWAGQKMRLDPYRLPQTVSYSVRDLDGDVMFSINERGAVIKRMLAHSGLPITVALPCRAFRGVAARAIDDGQGNVTVTLELMHEDTSLSVPLLVANDLDDVAADWRAWAAAYKLPMLLVEADGIARTLDELAGYAARMLPPKPRRKRPGSRRSRFLVRRKQGGLGLRLVISGEEIIARS